MAELSRRKPPTSETIEQWMKEGTKDTSRVEVGEIIVHLGPKKRIDAFRNTLLPIYTRGLKFGLESRNKEVSKFYFNKIRNTFNKLAQLSIEEGNYYYLSHLTDVTEDYLCKRMGLCVRLGAPGLAPGKVPPGEAIGVRGRVIKETPAEKEAKRKQALSFYGSMKKQMDYLYDVVLELHRTKPGKRQLMNLYERMKELHEKKPGKAYLEERMRKAREYLRKKG